MDNLKFKIRSSAIGEIMGGEIGLTSSQQETLSDLELRRDGKHPKGLKLTDKMLTTLAELNHKKANPELPEGAKTYCKQWLKEQLYKRREQIKSKYISKGHASEESGFTLMCIELNLGMVFKNEDRFDNGWLIGECDLDHERTDTVYDNKSSWSLDQFPMFETEIPSKDYEYQIQGYCEGYNRENGSVVYTLNDMPKDILRGLFRYNSSDDEKQDVAINLIYTREYWDEVKAEMFPTAREVDFVEIPDSKRVKRFDFKRDREFIIRLKERVELCQKYVDYLQKLL